jgi:succinoglycan biosynthesis transport protein ExoP
MSDTNFIPRVPALPSRSGSLVVRSPQPDVYRGGQTEDPESIEPTEWLRSLRRHKWTVILAVLAAVLAGLGLTWVETPRYRSLASVEVQGVNENFLNLHEVDPTATGSNTGDEYVETQAEMLQEDALIEKVVKKLNLEDRPDFQPKHSIFDGIIGQFGSRNRRPGPERHAVDVARRNLSITTARDSRIIQIAYTSTDATLAADFANTLARTFIEQSVEARRAAAQQIQEWLSPQLQDARNKITQSEGELENYTRSVGLQFTSGQESLEEERLKSVQDELAKAQADRIAKQAAYETMHSSNSPDTEQTPALQDYTAKLTDLRRQLADLESILQPESYKVVRIRAQIAQLESAVRTESKRISDHALEDFRAAERREETLAAAYSRQSAVVANLSGRVTHYDTLKHAVDANRQFYEAMQQRVNEARVASAIRQTNIRLVGPAEPAPNPYTPNLPLNLAVSLAAGLVLGVCAATFREQTNRRLRAPGEATSWLSLPELGAIPKAKLPSRASRKLLGGVEGDDQVERITWNSGFSEVSESFRSTVASILSADGREGSSRALAITSAVPGEGKTTVTSNLGIALAEIRYRVLLIDGDMRHPRLHKVFNVTNNWGLSDLLQDANNVSTVPLECLAKKTDIPRLHLLPSGPCPEAIFALLCSERMRLLMERYRKEFDYIIIDTPPCLEFADSRILARYAEGAMLVVRAEYTDKQTAQAAARRLVSDGIPVMGTVLNDWDSASEGGHYSYMDYRDSSRMTA